MAYVGTKVGALMRAGKLREAYGLLREPIDACAGNVAHLSRYFGVDVATMKRWLAKLDGAGLPVRRDIARARSAGVVVKEPASS